MICSQGPFRRWLQWLKTQPRPLSGAGRAAVTLGKGRGSRVSSFRSVSALFNVRLVSKAALGSQLTPISCHAVPFPTTEPRCLYGPTCSEDVLRGGEGLGWKSPFHNPGLFVFVRLAFSDVKESIQRPPRGVFIFKVSSPLEISTAGPKMLHHPPPEPISAS